MNVRQIRAVKAFFSDAPGADAVAGKELLRQMGIPSSEMKLVARELLQEAARKGEDPDRNAMAAAMGRNVSSSAVVYGGVGGRKQSFPLLDKEGVERLRARRAAEDAAPEADRPTMAVRYYGKATSFRGSR